MQPSSKPRQPQPNDIACPAHVAQVQHRQLRQRCQRLHVRHAKALSRRNQSQSQSSGHHCEWQRQQQPTAAQLPQCCIYSQLVPNHAAESVNQLDAPVTGVQHATSISKWGCRRLGKTGHPASTLAANPIIRNLQPCQFAAGGYSLQQHKHRVSK